MSSKNLFFIIAALCFLIPTSGLLAQTYLVGVPGIEDPNLNFGSYINALYALAISIGALMAVIKIIIAGMKYMLSDVVTSKQEAISDIRGSVLGLLVVISAVVVLNQINPQLTETNIFIETVKVKASPSVITQGNALVIQPGYRYSEIPSSVQNFEAECASSQGLFALENFNGKQYKVCYDALTPAKKAELAATFPGLNMPTIEERFRRNHIPRQMSPSAVPLSSLPDDAIDVVFAVQYVTPETFIDRSQANAVQKTCANYRQVLDPNIRPFVNKSAGYIACYRFDTPQTPQSP